MDVGSIVDTMIMLNICGYAAKIPIAIGFPLEQLATDNHNLSVLADLEAQSRAGNKAVLPQLQSLNAAIENRRSLETTFLGIAVLPTPLDALYVCYRIGKYVRNALKPA